MSSGNHIILGLKVVYWWRAEKKLSLCGVNLKNYKFRNKLSLRRCEMALNYLRNINGSFKLFNNKYLYPSTLLRSIAWGEGERGKINQINYQINVMPFQTISERAFDGLNNLKRLNLENNRLKTLERGLFTAKPVLTYLNLMRNSLETVTLHTIQPLMNNLVNHTSMLLIKGNLCFSFSNFQQLHQLSPPSENPAQIPLDSHKKSVFD